MRLRYTSSAFCCVKHECVLVEHFLPMHLQTLFPGCGKRIPTNKWMSQLELGMNFLSKFRYHLISTNTYNKHHFAQMSNTSDEKLFCRFLRSFSLTIFTDPQGLRPMDIYEYLAVKSIQPFQKDPHKKGHFLHCINLNILMFKLLY